MGYFKVLLEEGKKKKTERVVFMQGKDFTDTVLNNIKRFNYGRILDAYPVTREEYLKGVAAKE